MSATPAKPLLTLPQEVLDLIFLSPILNYHDLKASRLASRKILKIISFDNLKAARQVLKQVLILRELEEYNSFTPLPGSGDIKETPDFFACYVCLIRKPKDEFARTQTHGWRATMHDGHAKRFCIDCGWRKGIWTKGSICGRGQDTILICKICGDLKTGILSARLRKARICGGELCEELDLVPWRKMREQEQRLATMTEEERKADVRWDQLETATVRKTMMLLRKLEARVEARRVAPELGQASSSVASQSRRSNECLKCWREDHTEKPRSSGSEFCSDCEVELGLEQMTVEEKRTRTV